MLIILTRQNRLIAYRVEGVAGNKGSGDENQEDRGIEIEGESGGINESLDCIFVAIFSCFFLLPISKQLLLVSTNL